MDTSIIWRPLYYRQFTWTLQNQNYCDLFLYNNLYNNLHNTDMQAYPFGICIKVVWP